MLQPAITESRPHDGVDVSGLVEAARRGDRRAIRSLAERSCTLSLRTAIAVTGRREAASDISQDVAVDVIRGLKGLRNPAAFDSWVHRITVRHARRAMKRQTRQQLSELPIEFDQLPGSDSMSGYVEDRAVWAAVEELPPKQRMVVALHYVHDLTGSEIAAILRCREGTVHSLLTRARSELRSSPHLSDLRPPENRG